jgi:hypothetical protein
MVVVAVGGAELLLANNHIKPTINLVPMPLKYSDAAHCMTPSNNIMRTNEEKRFRKVDLILNRSI